jgi:D-beta-D-heptose 7-phosphate kinase/D-beta-D-heptose 1-phosphate adenosyltransferase
VIGLRSDASVQRLKDPSRPVIPETQRAHLLSALACVDYVVLFEEHIPLELIERIRPDVLISGEEGPGEVMGRVTVKAHGGRVEDDLEDWRNIYHHNWSNPYSSATRLDG